MFSLKQEMHKTRVPIVTASTIVSIPGLPEILSIFTAEQFLIKLLMLTIDFFHGDCRNL